MSTADDRYSALQRQARGSQHTTQELLTFYALEGFLSRLGESPFSSALILKGGLLLAALDLRRSTRDVDLAGVDIDNDPAELLEVCRAITRIEQGDGLDFDTAAMSAESIRDDDAYSGVRVTIPTQLASARLPFHVDISVGDPIAPRPTLIYLPRVLDGSGTLTLLGYPTAMALAEKIITSLERGTASTRWRDFVDIYLLARRFEIDANELRATLNLVAEHRRLTPIPMHDALPDYAESGQEKYANWLAKQSLGGVVPASFADLLDYVFSFADPLLSGATDGCIWDPQGGRWEDRAR